MTVTTHYTIYHASVIRGYYQDEYIVDYNNGSLTGLFCLNPKNSSWTFFATSKGWEDFAPSGRQQGTFTSSQGLDVPSEIIIERFEELFNHVGFDFSARD